MMMKDVYEILKEKGITLPQPPAKGGVYTPVQEFGDKFLYCSGCGPGKRKYSSGQAGKGSDSGGGPESGI